LGKEFGWSYHDLSYMKGHEVIAQSKRVLEYRKNNPLVCPLLHQKR